jgi:hypothetical protein
MLSVRGTGFSARNQHPHVVMLVCSAASLWDDGVGRAKREDDRQLVPVSCTSNTCVGVYLLHVTCVLEV